MKLDRNGTQIKLLKKTVFTRLLTKNFNIATRRIFLVFSIIFMFRVCVHTDKFRNFESASSWAQQLKIPLYHPYLPNFKFPFHITDFSYITCLNDLCWIKRLESTATDALIQLEIGRWNREFVQSSVENVMKLFWRKVQN